MTTFLLQGCCWKDHTRVEFTFTRGFGHVSEAAFAMCGNLTNVFSTDNSPQLTFRFTWQANLQQNFCKFEPANFLKKYLYTSVGQPQKRSFSIKKGILGCKSTTGKAAFQSNFKFQVGDTLKYFGSRALTFMLHYRIHGFLLAELTVRPAFQSYVFSLKYWQSSNENTAFC